jgi:formylglycine-generating enzyme required for sulfatase activity
LIAALPFLRYAARALARGNAVFQRLAVSVPACHNPYQTSRRIAVMTKELFDQLVSVLLPEMGDAQARKALVESALYGSPVLQKIQWEGAARSFTVQLVRLLKEFGDVAPSRAALGALLEEVKALVGADRQAQIDQLLPQLKSGTATSAIPQPAPPSIPPPPQTFAPGELYVFLSYARPDQTVAAQVETFLTAAGVRVFRDTSEIGAGDNWDLKIEQALRECQCMVLLLSAASMPERKEVHREWFNFDQKGKKIYPLYLQDCQLHSRFDARNYLDARTDLPGALERLRLGLQRDFGLPEAASSHNDNPLTLFRRERITEWEQKNYALDKRFVNLTLVLDKREADERAADLRFDNLRQVLQQTQEQRACVLLGAPGSGKSTLLRRLQLDHCEERLRDGRDEISFFIQLNGYRANPKGELPEPREWLNTRWKALYPALEPLETWLRKGRALLLLDALNEMPHKNTDSYFELVELWRQFAEEAVSLGNQLVFTCRRQDYSAALHIPVVEVLPMTPEQVQLFLKAYLPSYEQRVWAELNQAPQLLELYQRPYFLRLLCEQVELTGGDIPRGRAGLFTGFVRKALAEEKKKNSELFRPGLLLTEKDHLLLSGGHKYRGPFELPERGVLIPKLSELAFKMQEKGAQVRLDDRDASTLLAHDCAEAILKVGLALNVLDDDSAGLAFFHQLLQEYFAARQLARAPQPALVRVEWAADQVSPSLAEARSGSSGFDDWLPPLKQTGWEETMLSAAPMAQDAQAFIRALIPHNLPLAARCAAAPELSIQPELKSELQGLLLKRAQDFQHADLRARIAAGEALGLLGDPRFERRPGRHGAYLFPPLVALPGGQYPMGMDGGQYDDEGPAHTVTLSAFQIGQFPVTNAEYQLFIEAKGYEVEQWWDTDAARDWLRETSEHLPESWNDPRFNNPAQPVVGVSWYEARAYCNWLTATLVDGSTYRLPTEAEFEAAARGQRGRMFPYGETFDENRCNTYEGRVGRTTPVGVYANATPEGAVDLSGNAYTWTLSIYDQERFPYPYRPNDGREDVAVAERTRVLRGGSWFFNYDFARAVSRDLNFIPADRYFGFGFRVVVVRPPS